MTVVNLNTGNDGLLKACRELMEYMVLVKRIREYGVTMDIESAVRKAVDDCIAERILKDFLVENRAEVIEVGILEYDNEKVLRFAREEGREEGRTEGEQRLSALIQKLIEASRMDELEKIVVDKAYRNQLFEEFGL